MTETGCPKCDASVPCGSQYEHGNHVYIIELNTTLISDKDFQELRENNPDYVPGSRCFYVGYTAHRADCRFRQHKLFLADPEIDGFHCTCFPDEEFRYFLKRGPTGENSGTRGNKFAGLYGQQLVLEFNLVQNPIESKRVAQEQEKFLADDLRKKGFGVWQN